MAQLHCYVPDEIAEQLVRKAGQAQLTVSKYLAGLVKKEVESPWPDNYFDLFGSREGKPLERPEQGNYEKRGEFS